MRIVVPAGYMPVFSASAVTFELCSGHGPMTMVMPGMGDHHDQKGGHDKSEMPCGFSALATPSLAGAAPILLALAIAFIVAIVSRSVARGRIAPPSYLRPPLRAPPATA